MRMVDIFEDTGIREFNYCEDCNHIHITIDLRDENDEDTIIALAKGLDLSRYTLNEKSRNRKRIKLVK